MTITGRDRFLPADYQYYLSSWIYRCMGDDEKKFADFLQGKDYQDGHRRFRLFNFSPIDFRPYRLHQERGVFELQGDIVTLEFGCVLPDTAAPLIKKIFKDASAALGDRINRVDFVVTDMEFLSEPDFHETMDYRLQSLCMITRPPQGEEKYGRYLYPDDAGFVTRLTENLQRKYKTAGQELAHIEPEKASTDIKILPQTDFKRKKIRIKPFTPQQTDIKGSMFDCTMNAPIEVHKLVWEIGLGEKNSSGCGWVKIMD